jgi:phage shock protein A
MPNIFKRINDVLAANINDLIDRVEDPERMVKQIIREMETNIAQAKEGVVDAITSEKKLQKEVSEHRSEAEQWRVKAENALENNNEDLARSALVRKHEHDKILKNLEPGWGAAVNTSTHLKAQLRALEAKLEEAKRKKSTLVARQRAAEARQHMDRTNSVFEAGLQAHSDIGRMEERVAEIEARTEAISEVHSPVDTLESQFQAMEVDTEVEAELAALKKKLNNKDD